MGEAKQSMDSSNSSSNLLRYKHACAKSPRQSAVQDKVGESAMQAVNMLESMFEWLLQPARPDEGEMPATQTTTAVDGQSAPAMEVSTSVQRVTRGAHSPCTMAAR